MQLTEHIYPSWDTIQVKITRGLDLSAEEELLHLVYSREFDKQRALYLLQEWFPEERFLPIPL